MVLQALPPVKVVTVILVGRALAISHLHSDRQSQVIMKDLIEQEEDLAVTTTYVSLLPIEGGPHIFVGRSCWYAQHVNALR